MTEIAVAVYQFDNARVEVMNSSQNYDRSVVLEEIERVVARVLHQEGK